MNTVKLNIGCGNDRRPGYVGVDAYRTKAVDVVTPAWRLPYEAGQVDEIYTSHMVEHLAPADFTRALAEWRRVLRPGGRLTIRCPNFALYLREFLDAEYSYRWDWGIRNIFGWQDRGPGMLTRTGFTVRRLADLVRQAGFTVTRCATCRTRQSKGIEYRPDGDIICEAVRP